MPDYFDTGFSVREAPWHKKGLVIPDYPETIQEARELAGLTWEPREAPVFAEVTTVSDDGQIHVRYEPIEGYKQVVRSDTGSTLALHSSTFGVVPNKVTFEIAEALAGENNVKIITAGAAKGGSVVWVVLVVDEPRQAPGDNSPVYPFIAVLNAHDGSAACKAVNTTVKVVCWNTWQAASAEGARTKREFTFRHSAKVLDRIEEAKLALTGARAEADKYIELVTQLGLIPVSDHQVKLFLSEFIPEPPAGVVSDRVAENVKKARGEFLSVYNNSPTTEGIRGTAHGLLMTATEYLDHLRGYRNHDTYMNRTLLRPEPAKAKALSLIREVVKV